MMMITPALNERGSQLLLRVTCEWKMPRTLAARLVQ